MLKRFFTPKWQHKNDSVRELALNSLDALNDAEIITNMVTNDPSKIIREIALAKISDLSILKTLLSDSENPTDWCRLAFRLSLLSPQIKVLTAEFVKVKVKWDDDETFNAIARNTLCQELTYSLLLATDAPNVLFKIVTLAKSIELRLKALEDINDLEQLILLSKISTQKQVLQIIRAKISEAKSQQKIIEDIITDAEKLEVTLKKLSQQTWFDPQFEIKVNLAVKHWHALDLEKVDVATELQKNKLEIFTTNFQNHLKQCQVQIAKHKNELEQAVVKQDALDKQNDLSTQLENLLKEMRDPTMNDIESYQSVKNVLELLNSNWQQTIKESKPDPKVFMTYQKLLTQIKATLLPWENFIRLKAEIEMFFTKTPKANYESLGKWLARWNKMRVELAWINGFTMPTILGEWYGVATNFQTQYDEIVDTQKKKARTINQRIMLLEKHCQQRNLIAANRLINYINQKLNDIVSDFRNSLSKKIENLQPQLDELRDWHAFATGPKKNELCESMENLIAESIEPLVRAKKVRELQQQWRELLASDPNADEQLWKRFKNASERAYLPCLEFYAEKDKVRAENLKKRIGICGSLEHIVVANGWNAENNHNEDASTSPMNSEPDWKSIDKHLIKASREWKKYQPVPENEREAVQKNFNLVLSVIKKQLETEKQNNLDTRCELVKKAVKYHESDDVEKSIKGVLDLQRQWKDLGITFYKKEREQWLLFRGAIDRVFTKRDMLKKEFKSELKNNQEELKNTTKEIDLFRDLDDELLKQSYSKFEELKNSWTTQKELPRASAQALLNAFANACSRYQEYYAGLASRQKQTAFNSLLKGGNLLQDMEEKLLNDQSSKVDENQLENLKSALSKLKYDVNGKHIIDKRLGQIGLNVPAIENNGGLKQLQSLALDTEILLSIDSPENCKEQRVAIQLERLQNRFGAAQVEIDKKKEVLNMLNEWVTVGFINPDDRVQLESRRAKIFSAVEL
ncbi:MAG: hypothetical protein COA86_04455 [Kangiella sp.]|nr:MAG: hypothetical protein COA86_04455 [Kangiella sp.]